MKQFLSARPAFKKDERQGKLLCKLLLGNFLLKKKRKKKRISFQWKPNLRLPFKPESPRQVKVCTVDTILHKKKDMHNIYMWQTTHLLGANYFGYWLLLFLLFCYYSSVIYLIYTYKKYIYYIYYICYRYIYMYILFFCYICYYSFIFGQVDQSTLTWSS